MQLPPRLTLAFVASILAGPAMAHTGLADPGHGFLAGVEHPLLGLDHLLPMIAVGLWAGRAGGRALWAWPAAFVTGMLLGGALGFAQVALPALEQLILVSVVILGLASALTLRPPALLAAVAIVALGVTHGNAHGLEAPADGNDWAFTGGFVLATALLHLAGVVGARTIRHRYAVRVAGLVVAAAGLVLATG